MPISAPGRFKLTVSVLLAFLALAPILPPAAESGPPPLPYSFSGTVKLDGQNVVDGTVVSVWSADWSTMWTQTTTFTAMGESVYIVDVNSDDPQTGPVEGPVNGESVRFKIGDHVCHRVRHLPRGALSDAEPHRCWCDTDTVSHGLGNAHFHTRT